MPYTDNPHIPSMSSDFLYHLNIGTQSHDLKKLFSDVKFVCVGGSPGRMAKLAEYFAVELKSCLPEVDGYQLDNLTGSTDRYVIYKVGPIICASHGIGVPSMSVLLHEMFKLLHYAEAKDVTVFRLGTSGGLGLEPGTVVVTTEPVNGVIKPVFEQIILGKRVERPCILDQQLVSDILDCQQLDDEFSVDKGKTLCANDFYEGQGRLDGAICEYSKEDKFEFLKKLYAEGVRNIEMECTGFAALTHMVGLKGAVVCVTLLNRLIDDQVKTEKSKLKEFELRPAKIVSRYMKKQLSK